MKKRKMRKKVKNQGNTFIMVVATLSFLMVLVAAMLVAVSLCYRLKAYDINARDNFYYLEQAMDEIYAGVGADAMVHLNSAYDDTIEILVYFDAATQSYVTMENADANRVLKNTYMKLVREDPDYLQANILDTLSSFVSNKYEAISNPEGVYIEVGNVAVTEDELTIQDVILKREAVYSTVNTRKNDDGTVMAGDTFVQTITTDLVIGKPEFNVNFNTIDSDLNELYKFAFVADKGVEIGNATSKVNITGNIYAAADFYNKDYNLDSSSSSDPGAQYNTVSSYETSEARYKNSNGKNEKSMYSGLYIDGADVIIFADRIVVPGTIAAFNSAELTVAGTNSSAYNYSEIWADGIVLGGYSLVDDAVKKTVKGSTVKLRADAYISDDLELNAEASEFSMVGDYYGYNYASLDNRTYTDACVKANGGRSYSSAVSDAIADGATIDGQAHYNSSSIIVNGQDSSLDLSSVANMYIAGQAYIETSKQVTKHDKTLDANGKETANSYTVTNKNGETEAVEYTTVDYAEMSNKKDDNYTTDTDKVKNDKNPTNIQDYRTGEAISIKSNQLAYIPNWMVTDNEKGLFLEVPVEFQKLPILTEFWDDGDKITDAISKIPIIKSVISGKTYYFFDFSTVASENKKGMNEFMEAYAEMFKVSAGETVSEGEIYGFTDITDYDYFQVEMLKVNTTYDEDTDAPIDNNGVFDKIYSNSAITIKNGTSFTIKADSSSISPLTKAAEKLNSNISTKNTANGIDKSTGTLATGGDASVLANNVTIELQNQYKEVKWTLSPISADKTAVQDAHNMEESDITPINYFFNFNLLGASGWSDIVTELNSGYNIWISEGDVHVDANGKKDYKGMIICKGDVTFDKDVSSFEGLIVSGSKVMVDHTMNFTANEEIVKTILRECDESQLKSGSRNYFAVCQLFQRYQSVYAPDTGGGKAETESTKSISAVQYEDILSFNNWMKNVD